MTNPRPNDAYIPPGFGDPAVGVLAITPNDSTTLPQIVRALYIGSAGSVAVTMQDGTTATFANVPAGTILPIRVTQVLNTGTGAGNILGLY